MGGCFSGINNNSSEAAQRNQKLTANVISVNGGLRQYTVPVTASQVLNMESATASSFFVCNSDRLYYDDYIPALDLDDELEPAQIYFVLPTTKLHNRLAASDMAALAVKASVALQSSSSSSSSKVKAATSHHHHHHDRRNKNKSRISPLVLTEANQRLVSSSSDKPSALGISKSGSMRKLHKYSSRRAKMAVRSFRLRLTTIYEGSVLQFY